MYNQGDKYYGPSNTVVKVKYKVFYGQEPPSGKSATTECCVNYQLLSVDRNIPKQPNGELLVAVDHNKQRQCRQRR